ncbi:cupin domain-containing protein [bacterium AH-315-N03]|nr:cupin domain-containing protein [bacterium AH-315-N03]
MSMTPEQRRIRFTSELTWTATGTPGVEKKLLATPNGSSTHEVSIFRLAAGARLPTHQDGWGVEVVVLEGSWQLPEGLLGENGYSRRPRGEADAGTTPSGCTLYVRSGPFAEDDLEVVHAPAGEAAWSAGHGNLGVASLHSIGEEGTAFVHWPAGERFVPHQHWGGEEIFVLSGTFRDEHGTYPEGTWIQSPHLSAHHPFVEEETVIFVKTGHLPAV